jgi:hypothetical protein
MLVGLVGNKSVPCALFWLPCIDPYFRSQDMIVPAPGGGSPPPSKLSQGMARDIAAWTKAQKAADERRIDGLDAGITKLAKENKQLELDNQYSKNLLASVGYALRERLLKLPKGVSLQSGVEAKTQKPANTLMAQYAQIRALTAETNELKRDQSYLQRINGDYKEAIVGLREEGILAPPPVTIV